MSRLYDRLVRAGILTQGSNVEAPLLENSTSPVVISVQNVADYFYANDDGFGWSIAEDIPNVAPPFEAFFMEYRMPTDTWESWCKGSVGPGPHVGLTIEAERLDHEKDLKDALHNPGPACERLDKQIHFWLKQLAMSPQEAIALIDDDEGYEGLDARGQTSHRQVVGAMCLSDALNSGDTQTATEWWRRMNSGIAWSMTIVMYMELAGAKPKPFHVFYVSVKEDGSVPAGPDGTAAFHSGSLLFDDLSRQTPEEVRGYNSFARPFLKAGLLAISFMHCKNVVLNEHRPPDKLNKKIERKYGLPLSKYYTLEIGGIKETLRTEGNIESLGLKRALHICRGHFATYAPEKPLFGKYSGTFWKPQHVRGSKAQGEIIKDYKVKAPRG